MSKKLEQFVNDNREDFDKFEPGPVVWHNIQQQLKKPAEKKGILITMKAIRWSAAAAVIILLGAGVYYFMNNNKKGQEIAIHKKDEPKTNNLPVITTPDTTNKETKETPNSILPNKIVDNTLAKNDNPTKEEKDEYNEEIVHYTRLVELKQNQIMKIKTTEPVLYQKFAGDINKLDSTFHTLKKQLPVNPNREQILEAMIQNLQFQEALLNEQLNIIKKINHAKKTAYEKAIRSA